MKPEHLESQLITSDYKAPQPFGSLTTPIHHASTVTFANVAAMRARSWLEEDSYTYGLHATPTTYELQHRLTVLEGGSYALLAPSGLAAIALINLALLKQGDEVLLPQNIYGPNRELSEQMLSGFGVKCHLYDAQDVESLACLINPNTRLIWIEAPGSVSMEVPDVPAIVALAQKHGIWTALDNTWAAGVFFKAFEHGIDIAMQALTKYPSGGSDVLMGSIVTRDKALHQRIKTAHMRLGLGVAGDDVYLVLRGLPSLPARLRVHEANGMELATWFSGRKEVAKVLHPAFAECPGHQFWKRDFTGGGGLFSVVFDGAIDAVLIDQMVDRLKLFAIGFSWGGSHSLAVPYRMPALRPKWSEPGALVRFYIGLENPADLVADLSQAFEVFAPA